MRNRTFTLIAHVAGAVSATVVLAFTARMATVVADFVSWASEKLNADGSIGFTTFEIHGSLVGLPVVVGVIGATVAGLEHLVRTRRVRRWVPPVAVPTLCILVIGLLAGDEVGWRGRLSIAGGLGVVLGLAFDTWWFTRAMVDGLRHRIRTQGVA